MIFNNFIDNTNQTYLYQSSNTWDHGYPSGGNYWSDYAGVDSFSGPYQNETGGDGIGDTPYNVTDTVQQDRYPLMNLPTTRHDVAVVSVTPSKTVVGQGYSVSITVSFENQGDYTEKFNVTLNIPMWTQTITLTGETSVTFTFTWNTMGVPYGNYTITATATQVPGETDTTDNIHINGVIFVTIPGDSSGDGLVDISDFGILGYYWFNVRGYDPRTDFNNDNFIDISDFGILAYYWFQHI